MIADFVSSRPIKPAAPTGAIPTQRRLYVSVCFAIFFALVLVGVQPLQLWVSPDDASRGDFLNQLLHAAIFLALVIGGGSLRSRRELIPVPIGIAVLLGYCLLTVTWAVDPLISLRRLILTAMVIWVVFRCVRDMGYAQTLRILQYGLFILLIVNFLTVWLSDAGVHQNLPGEELSVIGDWRGILQHKNIAGAICAYTVILAVFDFGRMPKYLSLVSATGALIFLYFTHSKTSEVMLFFVMLCGWGVRPYQASYKTIAGVAIVAVAGLAFELIVQFSDVFQGLLGDPGLTGRDAIWPLLIEYWQAHPWTGAGFNSFWLIGDASPIWALTHGWVARTASHGHNGYLDLLVTIGLPGCALAVITLLIWPFALLMRSEQITKPQRSLLLALLIFAAGHNMAESTIMNGASVVQVMLLITVAFVHLLTRSPEPRTAATRGAAPIPQAPRSAVPVEPGR